ncbi:34866_t:CDS:2, partial [Gigaspora margarita]
NAKPKAVIMCKGEASDFDLARPVAIGLDEVKQIFDNVKLKDQETPILARETGEIIKK